MRLPHPHLLLERVCGVFALEGVPLPEKVAVQVVARLLGCADWETALHRWWTPGAIRDDEELSRGVLTSRLSQQIAVMVEAGLAHARAVDAVYTLRSTADGHSSVRTRLTDAGFAVLDGSYARVVEKDGLHAVEFGLGVLAGASLRVQSVVFHQRVEGGRDEAAELAHGMLEKAADDLRSSFVEGRAIYMGYDGIPVGTPSGDLDVIEVIGSGILRAYASDSPDPGTFILSPSACRRLPAFAISEKSARGFAFMSADGAGLMLPLVFQHLFSSGEKAAAEAVLRAEFPVTYRILTGGSAMSIADFHAASREWHDEHDPDLPEFMVVEEIRKSRSGRNVLVVALRTEDVLNKVQVPEGHLFVVPADEAGPGLVIDPDRHREVRSGGYSFRVLRQTD